MTLPADPTAEALRTAWAKYNVKAGPLNNAIISAADTIDRQAQIIALYQAAEAQRAADLARYLGSKFKPVTLSELSK